MPIKMELSRFRVRSFRSVDDSGWIEVENVTALIGTNESGKSNLLLPLWKLNPAKDGEIVPTSDYPRKSFTAIRSADSKPVFIEAAFLIREPLLSELAGKTSLGTDAVAEVVVKRRLDGTYEIEFPQVPTVRTVDRARLSALLEAASHDIGVIEPMKTETELKGSISSALRRAAATLPVEERCGVDVVESILNSLSLKVGDAPKTSSIVPRFERLVEELNAHRAAMVEPHPAQSDDVQQLLLQNLPKFVYYSNYGNLDSEIYLPHVIQNLKRDDLGQKESAKARTLKVLFEFVSLQPQEILELGKDVHPVGHVPTTQQVEAAAERKKERSILLQSASTRLTDEFRHWWKQGDYRFRFEADGDHFRIWVSDDRRPEEVELEGRSTGLQWFLSFYLVFLVESHDAHAECILLLDEPGLSLHPLAQKDLSEFFDGLAVQNQLIYTTHSPFLVDADRLDRARKVYVAADGTSKATADLGADGGDISKRGAGYAVHAALGLSVGESLLIGCEPIVVEGPSDQHYLTAIKSVLVRTGRLKPGRELVFPPSGGAKGIKAVASILMSRDKAPPIALLDSDSQGAQAAKSLRDTLYQSDPHRVLQVGSYVHIPDAEVEDLLPAELMARTVDRMIRDSEASFQDRHDSSRPIVPQIEAWAVENGAALERGWKVELARRVKRLLLDGAPVAPDILDRWNRLFADFHEHGSN